MRIFGKEEELSLVRLGGRVTFEPVLIPTLFLTHLTEPTKLLESLGLHLVGQVLGRTFLCFRHFDF